ncbi:exonuclease mut-7 homolog [Aricia agestis]|uniref:exonuclease mut-7 homolog n=1 Tax=Aricia agestis TaxID=91739 RepID=UPI001C208F1E|nr:exonuclease mut-7 homolog [Aricia agestis]
MNINQLVSNNQSIKIVPSVEESLRTIGLDVNIDKATETWFEELLFKWKTWKKSAIVDNHFYSFLESNPDPFRVALVCIVKCPEFKDCKVKSLPYYILESIYSWSQRQNNRISPPENLKLPAFHVGINQRNQNFLTLVIKTYHVCTIKEKIIPIAQEMIKNDNSKQALQIVIAMQLFEEISVEELLFPFILQDRPNMIDEYLAQCPNQAQPLITFLDNLLDKNFSVLNYSQEFAYKYNISNVNYTKVHYKPLGKLVARLCNKFNIPIETCKNLSKNRTTSGLKYLIHQKYIERNVSLSVWDDLVKDSLKNSIECAQEFIDILTGYDVKEALKWATHFNIPEDKLPLTLKNLSLEDDQEEEDWDDMNSNENQFYKIPISENNIVLIDKEQDFENVVSHLANCTVIGMDCEWKPSFGAAQSHVALIQIATYDNVYLIDTLKLNDKRYLNVWYKFNKSILENAEIIKVGFGLEQDLREMKCSIMGLSNIRIKGEGILDLGLLWKALIHCGLTLAAGSDTEGNGLSSLVQSCFGLPLEKSEQCSNWELRPLRKTQINYAAIDAYVLVAIYKYLNDISIEQRLNFDEVCNDVMLDKKPKSTKKTKVADRLLSSKFNFKASDAKNIKFLIEPELATLVSYLRYLGMDVIVTSQSMLWHDAVKLALSEDRFILTSKMKFSPTLKYPQTQIYEVGKVVNNVSSISEQITNILKSFNIIVQQSDLLTRCIKCNGLELKQLSTNEINKISSTVSKPNTSVSDDRYGSDNEDDAYYDNFLSDSEDDSGLYQAATVTSEKCLTSKGVEIETGDIHKIVEANKPATLCESCGKVYWDEDSSLKLESEVSSLLPIIGNKNY